MTDTAQGSQTNDNQTRVDEFRRLLLRPGSIITLIVLMAVGVPLGLAGSPFLAVIPLLLGILVIWFMADQKSQDSFFESYAKAHGMSRTHEKELPESTPLLRHDSRNTIEYLEGPLDDQTEGVLSLFQYVTTSQGIVDDRTTTEDHPYTLILVQMPETVAVFGDIYAQDQAASSILQGLAEVRQNGFEKLELESQAMNNRYEIFAKGPNPVAVRQLFSPTFIEWMTAVADEGFSFELENGTLCVYAKGHRGTIGGLDDFKATSIQVVKRIREEMSTKV